MFELMRLHTKPLVLVLIGIALVVLGDGPKSEAVFSNPYDFFGSVAIAFGLIWLYVSMKKEKEA